ncbi:MAG: glycosyltransferase family 1 protein [Acidobacteria bacterium]|nr:glycosyltransferase family 1 protein [Acidobacteriota bacterium]
MRLAFVTPRYGAEIGTGPEHACRLLAEQASERHDVDVLTTCARDPLTWKNEYTEGADRVRGVLVRRFAVSESHDAAAFHQLTTRLLDSPPSRSDELDWVRRLGPSSPALLEHLKRQHRSYDALVFFSLYHPTTVHGLAVAPERSVVFPYLQLDRVLRFSLWTDVLGSARAVGYLSAPERRLAHAFLRVSPPAEEVVGIGVDTPTQQTYPRHQQDPADTLAADDEDAPSDVEKAVEVDYLTGRGVPFRRRHRLYGSFALYGGRVGPDNGCEEMLEYFDSYAAADGGTALVLMGVKLMKVPDERYIRMAGVIPDRERMSAFEAADVTLAPAADDLLAQSLLESFAVGTPVLASARNEAAVEHCRLANAGLYYATRDEFVEALRLIMTNTRLKEKLGENGRQYIRQHHAWDAVLARFDRLVMRVRRS